MDEFDEFTNSYGFTGNSEDAFISLSTMCHVSRDWLEQSGPTIFVDPEIAQLCLMTDVGNSVRLNELKIVYPTAYIVLPDEIDFYMYGKKISHFMYSTRNSKNATHPYDPFSFHANDEIAEEEDVMTVCGFGKENLWKTSLHLDRDSTINEYSDICSENMDIKNDENRKYVRDVNNLFISLLLIMQSYPRYITKEPNTRPYKSRRKDPNAEVLTISRTSKKPIQQTVSQRGGEYQGGTHASPHVHWRRGHWRRQPHGDRWEIHNPDSQTLTYLDGKRYHMKWIEPIFVTNSSEQNKTDANPTAGLFSRKG
jgi:hypothetical protein